MQESDPQLPDADVPALAKTTASAGGCSTLGRRGRSANVRVGVGVRSLPPSFIQKFEDFIENILFQQHTLHMDITIWSILKSD